MSGTRINKDTHVLEYKVHFKGYSEEDDMWLPVEAFNQSVDYTSLSSYGRKQKHKCPASSQSRQGDNHVRSKIKNRRKRKLTNPAQEMVKTALPIRRTIIRKNKQTYQKLNNNANIQSPNRSKIEFDKKALHKRSTNDYTKTSKYTSRKFKTLSHMRRKNLASKINKAAQRKQKYLRAGLPGEAFRLNLKSNTKMPISEASSEDELTQNSSSDQSQTNLFKAGGKTNGIDQQPQSKRAKKLL